ncbi:DUF1636 family protein [Defluviimonas sp. SAOS-178_SWC]|uniref:DUF1636 family protein n=1 Tax=Defluviimonas sp. SAOS-178_SWC TaxID=3121287 RepID=UPI0032213CDA
MSRITVTVCRTCPAGQAGFAAELKAAAAGLDCDVRETDCMSGCTRPSTVAFRAKGKTAYLFGDVTEADIPNLLTFLRLYSASSDGTFADARPLGSLREKALARIPG